MQTKYLNMNNSVYLIFPLLIINLLLAIPVAGQPTMHSPRKIETPSQISKTTSEFILKTETIDFNGDNKLDYIVLFKNQTWQSNFTEPFAFEWWYTSNFKVVKKVPKYIVDYDYRWFINLDKDPEQEIVSARGYADGIDYSFYNQNLINGSDTLIFTLNPVLLDSSNKLKQQYWGYPWDITNIITRIRDGKIQIRCSLDHDIIRDSEHYVPDWQHILPVIFFIGKTTQPNIRVAPIRKVQWLTLQEIIEKVRK